MSWDVHPFSTESSAPRHHHRRARPATGTSLCRAWRAGEAAGFFDNELVMGVDPLVNIQKTMENHHFQWVNPL